jgi:hypothetical protein
VKLTLNYNKHFYQKHVWRDTMGQQKRSNNEVETVRGEYNWSETPPARAVVRTVSEATGRELTALEPLYKYVDPDGLNVFIQSSAQRTNGRESSLSFPYEEFQVCVWSGGEVVVRKDGL